MNGTEVVATIVTIVLIIFKLLGIYPGSWWWILTPPAVYLTILLIVNGIDAYKEIKRERHGKSN